MTRTTVTAVMIAMLAGGAWAAEAKNPTAADGTAKNWTKLCVSCHAKDGTGAPKMAKGLKLDLALLSVVGKTTVAKTDAELVKITADGAGKMPGYAKKLTADEITALVAFIRTLAPPPTAAASSTVAR